MKMKAKQRPLCTTCGSDVHLECCRHCGGRVLARRRGTGFCTLRHQEEHAAEEDAGNKLMDDFAKEVEESHADMRREYEEDRQLAFNAVASAVIAAPPVVVDDKGEEIVLTPIADQEQLLLVLEDEEFPF